MIQNKEKNFSKVVHFACVTLLPSSESAISGNFKYILREDEKKGILSRIKYLQNCKPPQKLQFYIDIPLMRIYKELANQISEKYKHLANCYEIAKSEIVNQLGEDICKNIDFSNTYEKLIGNEQYRKVCEFVESEYIDAENDVFDDNKKMRQYCSDYDFKKLRVCIVDLNRLITVNNLIKEDEVALYMDLDTVIENYDLLNEEIVDAMYHSKIGNVMLVRERFELQENQMIITNFNNERILSAINDCISNCKDYKGDAQGSMIFSRIQDFFRQEDQRNIFSRIRDFFQRKETRCTLSIVSLKIYNNLYKEKNMQQIFIHKKGAWIDIAKNEDVIKSFHEAYKAILDSINEDNLPTFLFEESGDKLIISNTNMNVTNSESINNSISEQVR